MRASGVYEDDDDMTKLKQDVLDMREDSKSKRTRKRENEQDRQDELELAGEKACSEAEERVSKGWHLVLRLRSPSGTPVVTPRTCCWHLRPSVTTTTTPIECKG
ncbi:hypothetical protein DYB31_011200 [Aphanomyces astaci]|uniref:Uncharacterized protein n=1 Tax=Aphanomyces astaci TaxID=112090 RepID=A0A397EHC7_APHAT|nr:hypothetical protein DYB31_011200 [Aphanomyces astaci]